MVKLALIALPPTYLNPFEFKSVLVFKPVNGLKALFLALSFVNSVVFGLFKGSFRIFCLLLY
jgi:hypothetical protein